MTISRLRLRAGVTSVRSVLAVLSLAVLVAGLAPASAQSGGSQPVARSRSVRAIDGKAKSIKLKGKAPGADKSSLTYSIVSFPQHGQITDVDAAKGKLKYTADAGYSGEDFFSFTVSDGEATSDPATVSITVYKRGQAPTGPQLTADEVRAAVQTAALSLSDPSAAIAVVDRAGRVLAAYRRPGATNLDVERALALARTGAFFSNNQAPLSSRTIRVLGGIHFPPGVRNTPSSDLYGIELTNRGCDFNVDYNPGKAYPVYTNLQGTGPGLGIGTGKPDLLDSRPDLVDPGGFPLYKNRQVAGGIGVTVAMPGNFGTQGANPTVTAAEYAAFQAAAGGLLPLLPLPFPGRVILGGLELPFTPFLDALQEGFEIPLPPGAGPNAGEFNPSRFVAGPVAGGFAADGWLVGPMSGSRLSAAEVNRIVQQAVTEALRTRAAIRLPVGVPTSMVVAVGDLDGTILGLFRMPDSTIFSIDVALTKARNVVWFSTEGARDLPGIPQGTAVTNLTLYFGGQPFFPIGIDNSDPGPFYDLFLQDAARPCTQGSQPRNDNQSGIVWFPGSAPLYSGNALVGGLGVSGDGVTQDDVVTFGGTQGLEAPLGIRADNVFIRGVRMPYLKFNRRPNVP